MITAIRSEFRKLLTARSTYFTLLVGLGITVLFAGFGTGVKSPPQAFNDPGLLADQSTSAIVFVGMIMAFIGLLLVSHEYRYNTITYTFTSSNNRLKVLLAKVFAVSVLAVLYSLLIMLFSPLCTIVGAHFSNHTMVTQNFPWVSLLWKCLFVGWGYAMYALLLAAILRNQVGAIISFLFVPMFGETILGLLLKENTKYLPFTALQGVVGQQSMSTHLWSPAHNAAVVTVYVVVTLVVTGILWQKRDAN